LEKKSIRFTLKFSLQFLYLICNTLRGSKDGGHLSQACYLFESTTLNMCLSKELLIASIALALHHATADSAYERGKELIKRQSGDLSFCLGTNSICAIQTDLHDECDAFDGDYDNRIPYYGCFCGNGFIAFQQA
jgi:hypothetical protein